jgi:hypothetical protein
MTWIAFVVGLLIVGLLFAWVRQRSSSKAGEEARFGVADFALLWPMLLTRREGGKLVRRDFTRRELFGWAVVLLIVLLAVLFDSEKR